MIKRKQQIALFLAFSLCFSCLPSLPARAEQSTEQPGQSTEQSTEQPDQSTEQSTQQPDQSTEQPAEGSDTEPETPVQGRSDTMKFLELINKDRLKKGIAPLAVTDNMQEAAEIRAKEIEEQCKDKRPDSKGLWYTVFADTGVIHDIDKIKTASKRVYNASEFRAAGASTVKTMYNEWISNSKTKASLLKSTLTHMGLGHTTGDITINGKKEQNPWVLLLIGAYKPDSILVKNVDQIPTVPKGLSIDDMGLVLQLRSISPEGYPCTGELPILSEMCTGYDSKKTGTQKVTVKYRCNYTDSDKKLVNSTLTTSFMVNVKKETPKEPAQFNAKGTSYDTVTISWSPVENATSYKIYRSTKKKSGYKVIKTLKERDLNLTLDGTYVYKNTGLTSGKLYYYKIKAFCGSTGSNYSSWDDAKPNVDAPSSVKVTKKSSTSVKVSWKKVKHATSYRVYYATSKNGHYKRAGITKKTSFTIRGLSKKKKTYYIKVLSYRKSLPGKYSAIITKKMR